VGEKYSETRVGPPTIKRVVSGAKDKMVIVGERPKGDKQEPTCGRPLTRHPIGIVPEK
jgi:CO dehydrogenase/acetyl-CoA synthase epsilon subunit